MSDGKLCYIIERFDRLPGGKKVYKEDMGSCWEQLAGILSERTSRLRG